MIEKEEVLDGGMTVRIDAIVCVTVSSIAEGGDGKAFGACSHRKHQSG